MKKWGVDLCMVEHGNVKSFWQSRQCKKKPACGIQGNTFTLAFHSDWVVMLIKERQASDEGILFGDDHDEEIFSNKSMTI